MNGLDLEAWRQVVIESQTQLAGTVATFLPSLLAARLILGPGWLVSKTVEALAGRALRRLGLDEAGQRVREQPTPSSAPDYLSRHRGSLRDSSSAS